MEDTTDPSVVLTLEEGPEGAARRRLEAQLRIWDERRVRTFRPGDLREALHTAGVDRSRAWLARELARLEDEGRVVYRDHTGLYALVSDRPDTPPDAADLSRELAYTVDAGPHPWQVEGIYGRLDADEARAHLRARHPDAADRDIADAMRIAQAEGAYLAVDALRIDHHADRYRLVRGGRRLSRDAALQVLVQEYRLTPDEADERLEAARDRMGAPPPMPTRPLKLRRRRSDEHDRHADGDGPPF